MTCRHCSAPLDGFRKGTEYCAALACRKARKAAWYEANRTRIAGEKAAKHAANPEPARLRAKAWNVANPEAVRTKSREWHRAHPEVSAAWKATNAERARELTRRWQIQNVERFREIKKKSRKKHVGSARALTRRRRARLHGAEGSHTHDEWLTRLAEFGGRCAYCGNLPTPSDPMTEDHVIPISRGGSDYIDNIVPAHRSCNARKGAKIIGNVESPA